MRPIDKEGAMPEQDVSLTTFEPEHGLAIREVVPRPDATADLIQDGIAGVFGAGLQLTGPPATIYHDEEFTPEDINVELFLPVAPMPSAPIATPAGRKLAPREFPAEQAAVTVFVGPYDELGTAYQAVTDWIADHGHRVAGPPSERYLSGPDEPGPPVTEIRFPVAPA